MSTERDILDERDFYELMQWYRHSGVPRTPESEVVESFEAVKTWLRANYRIPVLFATDPAGSRVPASDQTPGGSPG